MKVRAMRISQDGTRFREFAWSKDPQDLSALRGTITLSIHLCHFAEATSDIPSTTATAPPSAAMGGETPANDASKNHPVLAPPTTRPSASKLWTWHWRDDTPQAVFKFRYAPKEELQAQGIIPYTSRPCLTTLLSDLILIFCLTAVTAKPVLSPRVPTFKTHRPRMSTDVDVASPAGFLRQKQSLNVRTAWNWRNRGLSVSSDQSDISSSSSDGEA